MILIKEPIEFEWDQGNKKKNWAKHGVEIKEAEEVFFDDDKQEYPDSSHSDDEEKRKIVVGATKNGRLLFIVYTIRNEKVRIISARDLNKKKEKELYEEAA